MQTRESLLDYMRPQYANPSAKFFQVCSDARPRSEFARLRRIGFGDGFRSTGRLCPVLER